jgi:predicted  nucleic acid-binding Zn-ribbon protein
MASCSKCNGTKKVKCVKCGGKGQIESEWFKSLHNLPDERLYFEYEKRQREVPKLTMELISNEREIEELRREDERIRNLYGPAEYARRVQLLPYMPVGHSGILESRINKLEREMAGIQEVLESRHSSSSMR